MNGSSNPSWYARPLVGVIPACLIATLLLAPALFAGFFGDDFSLWHEGRRLIEQPSKILIGPSNFYRPANSWLFASQHLLFGANPLGYHFVTLLMHLTCGVLIGCVVGRFVRSPWFVFGAATIWMCSPFAFEPVQFVNVAYNDLTVLLVWLGLAALWPGPEMCWTRGRVAAALSLGFLSVFCKESWVILPGLVAAFERFISRAGTWRLIRTTAISAVPVAIYVGLYTWLFPGRGGYYEYGDWVLAKVPHFWASFMMLTPIEPYRATFGAPEGVALFIILSCALVGWKRRNRLVGLGFAFFACTMVPVVFIPFNPSRYTTAPLVGFVLVMAGVTDELGRWAPLRSRRLVRMATAAGTLAVFAAGLLYLRGDVHDMQRLRKVYTELLVEMRAFAPQLPTDRPILCVRMERVDPLGRLSREGSLGLDKLYFKRMATPYGLADWAQLFTYARAGHGGEIFADAPIGGVPGVGVPYAIVAHVSGRFAFLEPQADSLTAETALLSRSGYQTRLVAPWSSLDPALIASSGEGRTDADVRSVREAR